jgi:predicted alpha/beta hydrolase family esterase
MAADDWVAEVQAAIANSTTRISVATDGLAGSGSLRSRVMSGVQRHVTGARDVSPFDQELRMLYESGRISTVEFYEGGVRVANPFG